MVNFALHNTSQKGTKPMKYIGNSFPEGYIYIHICLNDMVLYIIYNSFPIINRNMLKSSCCISRKIQIDSRFADYMCKFNNISYKLCIHVCILRITHLGFTSKLLVCVSLHTPFTGYHLWTVTCVSGAWGREMTSIKA